MNSKEKLSLLRVRLAQENVDGFIIPRADEYQGEYIPDCADRLRFITGFTGSAGVCGVLPDRAIVMSDGRYTLQLAEQVDQDFFDTGNSAESGIAEWLHAAAPKAVIGYDPRLHTPREIEKWTEKGLTLKPLAQNPVDAIWPDRPALPASPVFCFPITYAGESAPEKLLRVAEKIKEAKACAALITLPDSIAWLLNIRAHDVPHIPVALSYGIAHADGTFDWFIEGSRIGADILNSFEGCVRLYPPETILQHLKLMTVPVIVDAQRTPAHLAQAVAQPVDGKDPVIALRARKNEAEQKAMRAAHLRDGVAVTKFLHWFSKEADKEGLSEMDAAAKLEEFRKKAPEFKEPSFDTIAGFGANGAIIHYRATVETNKRIERGGILLLDSGAQYEDGTTDITRTIAVGASTQEMKEAFTIVLKAHIAVASARFPSGTTGAQIDALARAPLWQHDMDYAHGTGHGVGCYLSVHEEAASLSPRGMEAVVPGMVLSNEPGFYKPGHFGIRIENLLLAREDGMSAATGKTMMCFETLTLAPFDKGLIVESLLTADEKYWLSQYHRRVLGELTPFLDDEEAAWLKTACS
jgi:Xaa-Pro aminopeptidase